MAYFERLDTDRFRTTSAVGGAWAVQEQHVAPSFGLLAHVVEGDHAQRRTTSGLPLLHLARLSYDIFGTMPLGEVATQVRVLRPGRTIELVEAELRQGGRTIVLLRGWLTQGSDTTAVAGTPLPRIAPPDSMESWDPTTVWPGGFIGSVEVRRAEAAPGSASYWVRSRHTLLDGEAVSDLARFAGLLDIANGMTVRADPRAVAFPNLDLTAHLLRPPRGAWVGFSTTVSFGPDGAGLTTSVVHDLDGPVGTSSQVLTVRPG